MAGLEVLAVLTALGPIITAGTPLVIKLAELFGLIPRVIQQKLTVEQVEAEVQRILKRDKDTDDETWSSAQP